MSGPEDIYVRIIMLADEAQRDMPAGRETSLALTRLDEAAFWARASVLRSRGRSIHAQDDASSVADQHVNALAAEMRLTQARQKANARVAQEHYPLFYSFFGPENPSGEKIACRCGKHPVGGFTITGWSEHLAYEMAVQP